LTGGAGPGRSCTNIDTGSPSGGRPLTCEQLGHINKPVTVARGEMTRPFYRIAADAVARCIPGAKLVVMPDWRQIAVIQQV
jgi:hypothetical protein